VPRVSDEFLAALEQQMLRRLAPSKGGGPKKPCPIRASLPSPQSPGRTNLHDLPGFRLSCFWMFVVPFWNSSLVEKGGSAKVLFGALYPSMLCNRFVRIQFQ
jgi:hypothetical protein